jgi:hypothetical protein
MLQNVFFSADIIRAIKPWGMKWDVYVYRVEQVLRLFQLEGRWEEATGKVYV